MGANGVTSTNDENPGLASTLLPDSIKKIVANRKFIMYDYGHHGKKWCVIYEDGDSYNFDIGSTRNERLNLDSQIDTAKIMADYRDLICWGMDTMPDATKNMARKYPEQWASFYKSLSVFDKQSDCIFEANNVVDFEGTDNRPINANFHKLSYLMYWLSAPEIRHLLPGFEEYVK